MNTETNCCGAPPGAGGAFFKMPLGLEVDTLRLGGLAPVGGSEEDILLIERLRMCDEEEWSG
jgi:hypothetical protein